MNLKIKNKQDRICIWEQTLKQNDKKESFAPIISIVWSEYPGEFTQITLLSLATSGTLKMK